MIDQMIGMIFKTKCGDVEVLEYINNKRVKIRFSNSGHIRYDTKQRIQSGDCKDPYYPKIYGVGFIGIGKYTSTYNRKLYDTWHSMLARCYCAKSHARSPTYIGCVVCPEWHNLQVFGEWYENNYIVGFQLDKDILGGGKKLYSPSTCKFVSAATNTQEACGTLGVVYVLKREGVEYTFTNINEFVRQQGLKSHSSISNVLSGKLKSSHGFHLPGVDITVEVFRLQSPEGDIIEFTNKSEFSRKYALQDTNVGAVLRGARKTHKGWRLPS